MYRVASKKRYVKLSRAAPIKPAPRGARAAKGPLIRLSRISSSSAILSVAVIAQHLDIFIIICASLRHLYDMMGCIDFPNQLHATVLALVGASIPRMLSDVGRAARKR